MKEGWIVVFDLDDTLVTNVENKPQLLDDTIVVLQKALEKKGSTVDCILLYTYNTDKNYIAKAVTAIADAVHNENPFDDYVFVKNPNEEPFPSKSAERIKDIYSTIHMKNDVSTFEEHINKRMAEINDTYDHSFKERILFLDDIRHDVLYNDIGERHYALLGKPPQIDHSNASNRQNEINKIMNILEAKEGGKRNTRRTYAMRRIYKRHTRNKRVKN